MSVKSIFQKSMILFKNRAYSMLRRRFWRVFVFFHGWQTTRKPL